MLCKMSAFTARMAWPSMVETVNEHLLLYIVRAPNTGSLPLNFSSARVIFRIAGTLHMFTEVEQSTVEC